MDNTEHQAWTEWFNKCAIPHCRRETQRFLKDCIIRAMQSRLNRLTQGKNCISLPETSISYFDTWFSLGKGCDAKGDLLKPRKEWALDNIYSGHYGFDQTIHGFLLGNQLFDIVKLCLSEESASRDPRLTTLTPEHTPTVIHHAPILQDELQWAVNTFVQELQAIDDNASKTIILLLDGALAQKRLHLAQSTYYDHRKRAINTIRRIFDANDELKDVFLAAPQTFLRASLSLISKSHQAPTQKEWMPYESNR